MGLRAGAFLTGSGRLFCGNGVLAWREPLLDNIRPPSNWPGFDPPPLSLSLSTTGRRCVHSLTHRHQPHHAFVPWLRQAPLSRSPPRLTAPATRPRTLPRTLPPARAPTPSRSPRSARTPHSRSTATTAAPALTRSRSAPSTSSSLCWATSFSSPPTTLSKNLRIRMHRHSHPSGLYLKSLHALLTPGTRRYAESYTAPHAPPASASANRKRNVLRNDLRARA